MNWAYMNLWYTAKYTPYTLFNIPLNTRKFKRMVISHRTLHALFWQQLYGLKKLLPQSAGHHNPLQSPKEAGSDNTNAFPLHPRLAKKRFVAPDGQAHTV